VLQLFQGSGEQRAEGRNGLINMFHSSECPECKEKKQDQIAQSLPLFTFETVGIFNYLTACLIMQ